jgi:gamma-glutamylcyclotransferase (GGCT)/AIG2-like uncharacterized protein YtfP
MDGEIRIFVYGTLMPGDVLWPELEPYARSWHPVTARGRLWDTGHGFPGVRFDSDTESNNDSSAVPGVLVELDPGRANEAVDLLDRIEDEGRLYRRVEVETSSGPALAYEWLGRTDGLKPLPDGWPRL